MECPSGILTGNKKRTSKPTGLTSRGDPNSPSTECLKCFGKGCVLLYRHVGPIAKSLGRAAEYGGLMPNALGQW